MMGALSGSSRPLAGTCSAFVLSQNSLPLVSSFDTSNVIKIRVFVLLFPAVKGREDWSSHIPPRCALRFPEYLCDKHVYDCWTSPPDAWSYGVGARTGWPGVGIP